MSASHTITELSGEALDDSLIGQLGILRIRVFREYPYLYDGDEQYEREYLQRYREAAGAHLVLVTAPSGELVGATTCLPMSEEGPEFREPFERAGIDVGEVFYFGESVLLPEWRGRGIGKLFFDRREAHARKLGYSVTTFCAADRPEDHPMRPCDYRPLDGFWESRGYAKQQDIVARFPWKEVGSSDETEQTLTFWLKSWS